MIRKYSKKGLEKRKEERECLPKFFEQHVRLAKMFKCEECGAPLTGHISEIAHILPKNYFKSIQCNNLNVLYLCGQWSEKQCHTNFDNFSQEKVKEMKIFPKLQLMFQELKQYITEPLNYKHYDKYE